MNLQSLSNLHAPARQSAQGNCLGSWFAAPARASAFTFGSALVFASALAFTLASGCTFFGGAVRLSAVFCWRLRAQSALAAS
eukprot:1921815-Pyramimonas_sp.AAC.1